MKRLLILILCAFCGVAFSQAAKYDGPTGKPYTYKTSGGTERQMEIYFPPNHNPAKSKVPGLILFHGGSAGGHISALATMNPGLNDPADPKDIDTSVVAYLWFNPAFEASDSKDSEIDILTHLKADLPPAISFFGDQDTWKKGWDTAHTKWKSLGTKSIDLWISPGQAHSFFNKEPWRTVTLIAADEFLVKQGLLTGQSTLTMPVSGEKLVATP